MIDRIMNGPSGEPEGIRPPPIVAVGAMKARDVIEEAAIALIDEAQHHDTETVRQAVADLSRQSEGTQTAHALGSGAATLVLTELLASRERGEPVVPRGGA